MAEGGGTERRWRVKAKKIRAWAVVNRHGDRCSLWFSRNAAAHERRLCNKETGARLQLVPLTGTFTPPKRKPVLAAVRGRE